MGEAVLTLNSLGTYLTVRVACLPAWELSWLRVASDQEPITQVRSARTLGVVQWVRCAHASALSPACSGLR